MLYSKGWSWFGLLALGFAATGQSSVLFEDDFDSSPAGSFPAGWTLLYEGAGSAAQFVDRSRFVSASQSLALQGSPCWSAHAYRPVELPAAGATVTVTTKVYSGAVVGAGCTETLISVGLFNPQNGPWGTPFGAVIFKPDGYMYAISDFGDGIAGTHVKVMQYAPNRWYSVRTDLDLDSKTLSVSVDGELKASGIRVHALDGGRPSGIHLAASHGDNPKAWFDDISVAVTGSASGPQTGGTTMDEASSLYQRLRAGDVATTKEVLSAARQLAKVHGYSSVTDSLLRDKLVQKAGASFLFDKVVDAFIDVVVDEMNAHGAFGPGCPFGAFCDRYVMTSFLRTGKNLVLLDVKSQIFDQVFLIAESWQETRAAIDNLPCIETLPAEEQERVRDLYRIKGWIGSKFPVSCQRAW